MLTSGAYKTHGDLNKPVRYHTNEILIYSNLTIHTRNSKLNSTVGVRFKRHACVQHCVDPRNKKSTTISLTYVSSVLRKNKNKKCAVQACRLVQRAAYNNIKYAYIEYILSTVHFNKVKKYTKYTTDKYTKYRVQNVQSDIITSLCEWSVPHCSM